MPHPLPVLPDCSLHRPAAPLPPQRSPAEKEPPPPSRYCSTVMATEPLTSRQPPWDWRRAKQGSGSAPWKCTARSCALPPPPETHTQRCTCAGVLPWSTRESASPCPAPTTQALPPPPPFRPHLVLKGQDGMGQRAGRKLPPVAAHVLAGVLADSGAGARRSRQQRLSQAHLQGQGRRRRGSNKAEALQGAQWARCNCHATRRAARQGRSRGAPARRAPRPRPPAPCAARCSWQHRSRPAPLRCSCVEGLKNQSHITAATPQTVCWLQERHGDLLLLGMATRCRMPPGAAQPTTQRPLNSTQAPSPPLPPSPALRPPRQPSGTMRGRPSPPV